MATATATPTVAIRPAKVQLVKGHKTLKAFVDVEVAGTFLIQGFGIRDGKNGLFVSMPKEVGKDGKWYERVRLVDDGFKAHLNTLLLDAYEKKSQEG